MGISVFFAALSIIFSCLSGYTSRKGAWNLAAFSMVISIFMVWAAMDSYLNANTMANFGYAR